MIIRKKLTDLLLLLLISVLQSGSSSASDLDPTDVQSPPIYLYGVEFTRPDFELAIASETYRAIESAVHPRKLIVRNVSVGEFEKVLEQNKADIVITNSGMYRRFLLRGWRNIVTLATGLQPNPDLAVGSVILSRKDLGITTIEGLRERSIILNSPFAFQGTLTIKKEILDQHFDPNHFFSKVTYLGTDPEKRLQAVRNKEADATFVSVCYLERRKRKTGDDLLAEFEIVGEKKNNLSSCVTSTDLYPNFSVIASPALGHQTIRRIVESLLKIPKNSDGEHWTFASDYRPVDEMFRVLKEGPYQHLKVWTLRRVWDEFNTLIVLLCSAIAFLAWHIFSTGRAVQKATSEIIDATAIQKKKTAETEAIKRALTVSSLSGIIVHELGQPLAASLFYSNSIKKLISEPNIRKELLSDAVQGLHLQLCRVHEIVDVVRSFTKKDSTKKSWIQVNYLVKKVHSQFVSDHPDAEIMIHLSLAKEDPYIYVAMTELEIALSNLLKNSYEALEGCKNPIILIKTEEVNDGFEIIITDNSGTFTEECQRKTQVPLNSKKMSGIGLGLTIVRTILTRHGFSFTLDRSPENNLVCRISIKDAWINKRSAIFRLNFDYRLIQPVCAHIL